MDKKIEDNQEKDERRSRENNLVLYNVLHNENDEAFCNNFFTRGVKHIRLQNKKCNQVGEN